MPDLVGVVLDGAVGGELAWGVGGVTDWFGWLGESEGQWEGSGTNASQPTQRNPLTPPPQTKTPTRTRRRQDALARPLGRVPVVGVDAVLGLQVGREVVGQEVVVAAFFWWGGWGGGVMKRGGGVLMRGVGVLKRGGLRGGVG